MIVMITAITPSLKASSRPFVTQRLAWPGLLERRAGQLRERAERRLRRVQAEAEVLVA